MRTARAPGATTRGLCVVLNHADQRSQGRVVTPTWCPGRSVRCPARRPACAHSRWRRSGVSVCSMAWWSVRVVIAGRPVTSPSGASARTMATVIRLPTGSRWTAKLWPTAMTISSPCWPIRVESGARIAGGVGLLSRSDLDRAAVDFECQQTRSGRVLAGVGHQFADHQLTTSMAPSDTGQPVQELDLGEELGPLAGGGDVLEHPGHRDDIPQLRLPVVAVRCSRLDAAPLHSRARTRRDTASPEISHQAHGFVITAHRPPPTAHPNPRPASWSAMRPARLVAAGSWPCGARSRPAAG